MKTEGPAWGLSLFRLTDSRCSARSSMKNFGEIVGGVRGSLAPPRHKFTKEASWICAGISGGLVEHHQRRRLGEAWKLVRKYQRDTIEKLRGRDAGILLRGGPEVKEHPREV